MLIREVTRDDLPRLLDIYNQAITHTTATFDIEKQSLEQRKRWFERLYGTYPFIVAEMEGKVVGYSCLSPFNEKEAFRKTVEISIYIHPDYQGNGIGKALLKEIVKKAKEARFHVIVAVITGGNLSSVRLHEKFGFKFAGKLQNVGYKFDQWLDVEYYQLTLP